MGMSSEPTVDSKYIHTLNIDSNFSNTIATKDGDGEVKGGGW